jgi:hypothetical protein
MPVMRYPQGGGPALDLARGKTVIGRRFHLTYTIQGVRRLLIRNGSTCQVPARRAMERDDEEVAGWVNIQLRLARPLVADLRRPWRKPSPPDRLIPARVRRDFRRLRPKAGVSNQRVWPVVGGDAE